MKQLPFKLKVVWRSTGPYGEGRHYLSGPSGKLYNFPLVGHLAYVHKHNGSGPRMVSFDAEVLRFTFKGTEYLCWYSPFRSRTAKAFDPAEVPAGRFFVPVGGGQSGFLRETPGIHEGNYTTVPVPEAFLKTVTNKEEEVNAQNSRQ